jgi:hypothetical protein
MDIAAVAIHSGYMHGSCKCRSGDSAAMSSAPERPTCSATPRARNALACPQQTRDFLKSSQGSGPARNCPAAAGFTFCVLPRKLCQRWCAPNKHIPQTRMKLVSFPRVQPEAQERERGSALRLTGDSRGHIRPGAGQHVVREETSSSGLQQLNRRRQRDRISGWVENAMELQPEASELQPGSLRPQASAAAPP